MPEQQRTATNRLADVIQVVLFARQTGVLLVERGAGTTFEEGKIIFVDGQVVQASAQGGRSGLAAFNWLNSWTTCWFMFIPTIASALAPSASTLPVAPSQSSSPTAGPPPSPRMLPPAGMNGNTGKMSVKPLPGTPVRIHPVNEVMPHLDRMDLSRMHRRLFLLIDGHRDPSELARLTGQRIEDIYRWLDDLERVGLIQQ